MNDEVAIKVHLNSISGSDQKVIKRIGAAIDHKQPFGLKCKTSMIVYIPHELRCYWVGVMKTAFDFKDIKALTQSAAMQYLSHKEFVSTIKLLDIAKKLKCHTLKPKSKLIL